MQYQQLLFAPRMNQLFNSNISLFFNNVNISYCFSGHVITMECLEKLIKKDWLHPLTGEKLTEKDIIPLQRV